MPRAAPPASIASMNKTLIAALVAATALLAPAAAQAATVSLDNGAVVYRADGTEAIDVYVSTFKPWDEDTTYLILDDDVAQTITSGPCFKSDAYPAVFCPLDGRPSRSRAGTATTA